MPVNPRQTEPNVASQTVPPQTAQNPEQAAQVASDLLRQRANSTIDPDTLQLLMSMLSPVLATMQANNLEAVKLAIAEMRKPTPEEEAKLLAEKERQKQRSVQATKAGEMEAAMIKSEQNRCQHQKPNGDHTFRGQVHGNGWAQIKCQRCYIKFNVRPLPEHIANGLNLGEIRGLTVDHLRAWQKNSAEIDRRIRASQDAMRNMSASVTSMAGQSAGL